MVVSVTPRGRVAGQLERGPRDVGPRSGVAGVGQVVDAVRRPPLDERDDPGGQVVGEGESADLVGDDRRGHPAGGQPEHGPDEVGALPGDPGGAHDVVPGGHGGRDSPAALDAPYALSGHSGASSADRLAAVAVEDVLAWRRARASCPWSFAAAARCATAVALAAQAATRPSGVSAWSTAV